MYSYFLTKAERRRRAIRKVAEAIAKLIIAGIIGLSFAAMYIIAVITY